jgi:hypothetical protein
MKLIISAIIKILNYLKTDEPKPELVKTVFRRINCFKIKEGSSSSVLFLVLNFLSQWRRSNLRRVFYFLLFYVLWLAKTYSSQEKFFRFDFSSSLNFENQL